MPTMTMQQAIQHAHDLPQANSLAGVVAKYATILNDVLWPEAIRHCQGATWVNMHPVSILYADKVATLTGGAPHPLAAASRASVRAMLPLSPPEAKVQKP